MGGAGSRPRGITAPEYKQWRSEAKKEMTNESLYQEAQNLCFAKSTLADTKEQSDFWRRVADVLGEFRAKAEKTQLELNNILRHWNEFGPDEGFEELLDRILKNE